MPVSPRNRSIESDIAALSPSKVQDASSMADLKIRPNWPFLYRVSVNEFDLVPIDGEKVLIPKFGCDVIEPGVNNVKGYKPDSFADVWTAAGPPMTRKVAEGWRYLSPDETIPADFLPDGVPAGGFLRRRRTVMTTGLEGYYWHDCWTTFEPGGDGQIIPVKHPDLMYRYLRAANVVGIANPGSVFDLRPSTQALARVRGPHANAKREWERALSFPEDVRKARLDASTEALAAVDAAAAVVGKTKAKAKPGKRDQAEPEVVA
jgi:hypothetical protein